MQKFSFDYYKHLLSKGIDYGFNISSFEKFDSRNNKTIILRHDIDYTLDGMLEFAEIEKELGCSATYLFRVHADEYNLFSCTVYSMIKKIINLGHEVGLHFEAMNVGRALNKNPLDLLIQEKLVIESILGLKIKTCSEHRELSATVHNTPCFRELYNPYDANFEFYAMDSKYCHEMKYLSDSNANWREGDPLEHYENHSRMQILIHPDWWFEDDLLLKSAYVHPRRLTDY